jgi:hypothetical protein
LPAAFPTSGTGQDRRRKGFMRQPLLSCGCIISHSAAIPIAIGTVVNFKEAHVFEKLRSNFSKTCAFKEFYLPPQAAI